MGTYDDRPIRIGGMLTPFGMGMWVNTYGIDGLRPRRPEGLAADPEALAAYQRGYDLAAPFPHGPALYLNPCIGGGFWSGD